MTSSRAVQAALAAAVLVLGGCGGTGDREPTGASDRVAAGPSDGVPVGRVPSGTVYDFGPGRPGAAEIGGAYFIGRPDARVTVASFGDFQCQFCARSHAATAGAREELLAAGTVRIVYLDFPLPMHGRSRAAAEFARCAGRVDGAAAFWRVHAALHRLQDVWTGSPTAERGLRTLASRMEIGWPAVSACMESESEEEAVERFRRLGHKVGVRGTPTRFFNGSPVVGAITGAQFREAVGAAADVPR